ncbi:hypothetical protein HY58_01150 [Flavihumibacter sp. ZG627]|nr:hypothetical protein HY58_01150 [Flavihumibacter sp. ZG627]
MIFSGWFACSTDEETIKLQSPAKKYPPAGGGGSGIIHLMVAWGFSGVNQHNLSISIALKTAFFA